MAANILLHANQRSVHVIIPELPVFVQKQGCMRVLLKHQKRALFICCFLNIESSKVKTLNQEFVVGHLDLKTSTFHLESPFCLNVGFT